MPFAIYRFFNRINFIKWYLTHSQLHIKYFKELNKQKKKYKIHSQLQHKRVEMLRNPHTHINFIDCKMFRS